MINYLMICRSLTYAQKAAKVLERAGMTVSVTRTPPGISEKGCGYCIKVPERRLSQALVMLKSADLAPTKIYVLFSDGNYSEVGL